MNNKFKNGFTRVYRNTVKLGYSNIGFCDTLSIASNVINIVVLIIQRYSFITTLFLGPFDDVITKFYCMLQNVSRETAMWKGANGAPAEFQ
jgi:hypothetical protein